MNFLENKFLELNRKQIEALYFVCEYISEQLNLEEFNLKFKNNAGILLKEVDERNTTRTCHSCKSLTGPKGLDGLRIREWTCGVCGDKHQRDINAAKNILAVGHDRLVEGIPLL